MEYLSKKVQLAIADFDGILILEHRMLCLPPVGMQYKESIQEYK